MLKPQVEKTIAKLLYLGVPFTSIFVWTGTVSDPVNVTKLLSASIFGFSVMAILVCFKSKMLWYSSRVFTISSIVLVTSMLIASILSESSFTANFYGTFGRNTGLLAYSAFIFLALGASTLRDLRNFNALILGLLAAGAVNVVYCLWAWQIGDFIGWSNPFGTILGTFGNPNFISSFLGIIISAATAFVVLGRYGVLVKSVAVIFILVAFLEILHTHSIQGVVVTGIGLAYVGFLFIREWAISKIWSISYLCLTFSTGFLAVAGMLQKGPLAGYLYKTSVSLRGEYWQAGINMGQSHPLTGIGMDGYGYFYRQERDAGAIVLPGASVVTNAAHNVIVDFFAYGGYPLLFAYLFFWVVGGYSLIKLILRNKKFDPLFAAISVAWICYQAQSIISINQIGLAIWGWVLTGALVGYERSTRIESITESLVKKSVLGKTANLQTQNVFSPTLIGGLGMVLGALIAIPPYNADAKWREALASGKIEQVESSLKPSYMTPSDSNRLAQVVNILEQNKLSDQAYKYAKYATEFNPNYFDAWKMLYYVSKSTVADKSEALNNLKRLDPLNPDVLGLPG
jgi:hypothetical protein